MESVDTVIDAIKALPRDQWPTLAADSGVPLSTIEKIAYRVTKNPGFEAIRGLVLALDKKSS